MIDFTYPESALEPEAVAEAVDRMTGALLRWEGAPDNQRTRAMAWAFVHELPAPAIRVGGREIDRPVYRVVVTVPAGTLLHGPGPVAANTCGGLVREVTEIVLGAEGTEWSPAHAARVYCLVQEIREGHWGGMGEVFRMQDIASLASPDLGETPLAARARDTIDELAPQLTTPAGA